jgi:hypothetical protein
MVQQNPQKECYISDTVVETTLSENNMLFKAGDRVHVKRGSKEGTIVNNEGTKMHPYYVALDDNSIMPDYYREEDLEPSKIPVLSKEMIDHIIYSLHRYGNETNSYAFGLPIYNDKHMNAMRDVVKSVVSPPLPALPERREKQRAFTDLDKKIAESALLFEAKLGYSPVRIPSTTLMWGWRYDSDEIQRQFRLYCTEDKREFA